MAAIRVRRPSLYVGFGSNGDLVRAKWNSAADLPYVSKCFRRIVRGIDRVATLHGVVFDILVGGRLAEP